MNKLLYRHLKPNIIIGEYPLLFSSHMDVSSHGYGASEEMVGISSSDTKGLSTLWYAKGHFGLRRGAKKQCRRYGEKT
jgi:hypothetical protein